MNLDLHEPFFFFSKCMSHKGQHDTIQPCFKRNKGKTFAVHSEFNKQAFNILENTLIHFYCQKALSCMSDMTVQLGAARPHQDRKQLNLIEISSITSHNCE